MGKESNSRQKTASRMMFSGPVREIGVFVTLIIVTTIFALIGSSYVTVGNFVGIVRQVTISGALAIDITFVIILRGIDPSLGSMFTIVAVVTGRLTVLGVPPVAAICVGAVLGTFMGSINGLLITKMRLQSFIATLGAMSVLWGTAYVVTDGWPALNIPDAYRKSLGTKVIGDVPISIFVLFAIVVIVHILPKRARSGNYLPAVGGNERATKLSGVNVDRTRILACSMCGFCVTFAGMIMLANLGTDEPATGQGYELDAITASAAGGTRVAEGKGSVLGTSLGTLLLAALKIGPIITGTSTSWQYIVTGIIIVIAAYLEVIQSKPSPELSKSQA